MALYQVKKTGHDNNENSCDQEIHHIHLSLLIELIICLAVGLWKIAAAAAAAAANVCV
jgi:uncharacterized membrane protein YiaA